MHTYQLRRHNMAIQAVLYWNAYVLLKISLSYPVMDV